MGNIKFNDVPFVPSNDCARFEECQKEAHKQGRADMESEVMDLIRYGCWKDEDELIDLIWNCTNKKL